MNRSSEHIGVLAALAAGILWGFLGPAVRLCTDIGLTSVQMTWLRYMVVMAILIIYMVGFRRKELRTNRSELILFLVMAVIGVMLNSTLYFQSMLMVSLSLATVLQYLSPFIVVAFSVPLFHEKLTTKKLIALFMAFIGCILCTGLISEPGSMDLLGIAIGAASGFCYATYVLCSKKLARNSCSSNTILFYTSIFCFIGLMPICDPVSAIEVMSGTLSNVFLIVFLGILLTFAPFWLFNYSLEKIEAGKASIIAFVEPLVATILGFALYEEILTIEAAVGMLMIIIALVVVNKKEVQGSEDPVV